MVGGFFVAQMDLENPKRALHLQDECHNRNNDRRHVRAYLRRIRVEIQRQIQKIGNMALLAMAVYDTVENGRAGLTRRTLESLANTVDLSAHRIFLVINAGTQETMSAIMDFNDTVLYAGRGDNLTVIRNAENIGTARAINKAWAYRKYGENAIKMDNDVVIHRSGWVEEMEECICRMPKIGIIGLKRKDLWENPDHPELQHRSTLKMVPHQLGQKNLYVEIVNHVMGTCQMYNSALLDKIGYLYQPGLYGYDDSLAAIRCNMAGFLSCFLCGVEIDHIDPGGNDHTEWKRAKAGEDSAEYHRLKAGYMSRSIGIYYDADGVQQQNTSTTTSEERPLLTYETRQ